MKYVVEILLLAMLLYILSFARYNWKNKNRLAAIGAAIIGFAAFTLFSIVLFSGKYET